MNNRDIEKLYHPEIGSDGAPKPIPYSAFECAVASLERSIHRLWVIVIAEMAIIFLAIAGLIGMFIYEAQFEDVVTLTQDAEASSDNAKVILNGSGTGTVNYYGSESETDDNKETTTEDWR